MHFGPVLVVMVAALIGQGACWVRHLSEGSGETFTPELGGSMSLSADFLSNRFPLSDVAQSFYKKLLVAYQASGLAPPNFASEVTSGDDGKFLAHVWEALLYRHLTALGCEFRTGLVNRSGQRGPDFGIIHRETTVWIEAVVPSPEGIPSDSA